MGARSQVKAGRPRGEVSSAGGRALAAMAVGLMLLALLALQVRIGPLVFDPPLAEAASALRGSPIVRGLDILVSLPVWSALVVIAAVIIWRVRMSRAALLVLASLSAELATAALKASVDRPRPPGAEINDLLVSASFPSGHMVRAVVTLGLLTVVLARIRPSLRAPFFLLATIFVMLLAVARVASGEHYASDVLGGLLLGAIWLRVILLGDAVVPARARP